MRALITGATGFVGPHLVALLHQHGDDVVLPGDASGSFDITDPAAVLDTFTAERPEVVYHLAGWSDVGGSWREPAACRLANIEGTANVLDAARACDVRRVLVVGSSEEYGRIDPDTDRLHEDAPLRPVTPYGASKVAASFLAVQAWLGHGLETVRVRSFGHTGPGQSDRFVVPALARRVLRARAAGEGAIAMGARDPVRDLSDVRDVVAAYRLVMERGTPGEVYNVCSGAGVSTGEVADRIIAITGGPLDVLVDPAFVRPTEVPRLVGDPTKLATETGWSPRFSLDDTLQAVLDDARADNL